MPKSVLFLFLILISSLCATPTEERIDINTDLYALSASQIQALREVLDDSIWDLLPQESRQLHGDLYPAIERCTERTKKVLERASISCEARAHGNLVISSSHMPIHMLLNNWTILLDRAARALSTKPEYQSIFVESDVFIHKFISAEQAELVKFRTDHGTIDDQWTFFLEAETDTPIQKYFQKAQEIINKMADLCLGINHKEGIFSYGDQDVLYIRNISFMTRKKGFFYKPQIRTVELISSDAGAPCIAKLTYLLRQDEEGNRVLHREQDYLACSALDAVLVNEPGPLNPASQMSHYFFLPGDHPKNTRSWAHIKQPIFPSDGDPALSRKQAVYDFVSQLFAPLLENNPEKPLFIAVPSTNQDCLLLEIRFLKELLQAKQAQASLTSATPPVISEEIQVIEAVLEEKQTQLKQTFEEENPEVVQKTKEICEREYEAEWEKRKKEVIAGTAGLAKNQKRKQLAKLAEYEATWKESRAQTVQQRQSERIQKKLEALKKESNGRFGGFYQGLKHFFIKEGILVTLTQTGKSGSHNHKLEFNTDGESAGSIIVPNKPITRGLLDAICGEISQLSERLFG